MFEEILIEISQRINEKSPGETSGRTSAEITGRIEADFCKNHSHNF